MSPGVTIAFLSVGFLVVGYFLYQQQEDTQILLAQQTALVSKAVNGGQKSILQEIGDVIGFGVKIASAI